MAIPPLLAAAIPALAGVAGNAINAGVSIYNNRDANRLAIEQSNKAYERQLEVMNIQNHYNSPAAQIQRLQQAGLNPNLVYGNGAPSSSVSLANVNVPQMRGSMDNVHLDMTTPIYNSMQMLQQSKMVNADTSLKDAQSDLVREQINTEIVKQDTMRADAGLSTERIETEKVNRSLQKLDRELEARRINIMEIQGDARIKYEKRYYETLSALNEVSAEKTYQSISNEKEYLLLQKILTSAQVENLQSSAAYTDAMREMTDVQRNYFNSVASLRRSQEYYSTQILKNESYIKNNSAKMSDVDLKRLERENSGYRLVLSDISATLGVVQDAVGIYTSLNPVTSVTKEFTKVLDSTNRNKQVTTYTEKSNYNR